MLLALDLLSAKLRTKWHVARIVFHPCGQFLNSIKLGKKKLQGIERSIGAAPRNSNACKICGREKKKPS